MRKTVSFGARPGATRGTPSVDDWVSSTGDTPEEPAASRERMKRYHRSLAVHQATIPPSTVDQAEPLATKPLRLGLA